MALVVVLEEEEDSMEYAQVDEYIIHFGKYFTETDLMKVRDTLLALPDDRFLYETISYRNPVIMFVVSFLFGMWGLDRFLLGETKNGLIKFFTMGLFGLWTLFDWIMIVKLTKEYNYRLFHSLVNKLY